MHGFELLSQRENGRSIIMRSLSDLVKSFRGFEVDGKEMYHNVLEKGSKSKMALGVLE